MPLAVLYNAMAYGLLASSPDSSSAVAPTAGMDAHAVESYSASAVHYIDTFFLNPLTSMTPNLAYGQLIRGPPPQGQQGQFMGIVDARGFVQVWNSIGILKTFKSPDWTASREKGMMGWAGKYQDWLAESALGQKAATSPK